MYFLPIDDMACRSIGVKLVADQLAVREATLHNWVKLVTNPLYCSMTYELLPIEEKYVFYAIELEVF